jgi:hypothetical protein
MTYADMFYVVGLVVALAAVWAYWIFVDTDPDDDADW